MTVSPTAASSRASHRPCSALLSAPEEEPAARASRGRASSSSAACCRRSASAGSNACTAPTSHSCSASTSARLRTSHPGWLSILLLLESLLGRFSLPCRKVWCSWTSARTMVPGAGVDALCSWTWYTRLMNGIAVSQSFRSTCAVASHCSVRKVSAMKSARSAGRWVSWTYAIHSFTSVKVLQRQPTQSCIRKGHRCGKTTALQSWRGVGESPWRT